LGGEIGEEAPYDLLVSCVLYSKTGKQVDLLELAHAKNVTVLTVKEGEQLTVRNEFYSWTEDVIQATSPRLERAFDFSQLLHELGHIAQSQDPTTKRMYDLYNPHLISKFRGRRDEIRGETHTNMQLLKLTDEIAQYYSGLEVHTAILEKYRVLLMEEDLAREASSSLWQELESERNAKFRNAFHEINSSAIQYKLGEWPKLKQLCEEYRLKLQSGEDSGELDTIYRDQFMALGLEPTSYSINPFDVERLMGFLEGSEPGGSAFKGGALKYISSEDGEKITIRSGSAQFTLPRDPRFN
jgi:hypothetical protein